jgi:hypothetical protein
MRFALALVVALPLFGQNASVRGSIVGAAGTSIANAPVELVSGTQNYKVQTDRAGVYRFSNLPAGEYKLRFLATGFQTLTLISIVLAEREQKQIPMLTLDVGLIADCGFYPPAFRLLADDTFGALAGSVIGASDVDVTLVCRTFSQCSSTRTDSNGRFSFSVLSPGEYGLSFRRAGFYPELATGYMFLVKAGLESEYRPVAMDRCTNDNCDPKLRPKKRIVTCE